MGTRFEKVESLPGLVVCTPDVYKDSRGWFTESFQAQRYWNEGGIKDVFVQDNRSRSTKGVLRGLHFQLHRPQAKLVSCTLGEIWDVAVDIRRGSPTFAKWFAVSLSAENRRQIYIPRGFAHGFCVLSDVAEIMYKCSEFFDPKDDRGIAWNDPDAGVEWPVAEPILSDKDKVRLPLSKLGDADLPRYEPGGDV